MSARVSTMLNVSPGPGRYVFFLMSWDNYETSLRDELNKQVVAFGGDLGPSGWLIEPYPDRKYDIARELEEKPWPQPIAERLVSEQDPIILVLDRGWESFDPASNPYAFVWLSEFKPEDLVPLFKKLAALTKSGADVIDYLYSVAKRQSRSRIFGRARSGGGATARLASYFEIKPTIFGVSIDLKAILGDLGRGAH